MNGIDARNGSVAVLLNTCVSGELPIDQDQDGVPDSEDICPQSNLSPTVVIAGRDSGVANLLLPGGCTISDEIAKCSASGGNFGSFMSCVAHLAGSLKEQGIITDAQKDAIVPCAARSLAIRV